MVRFDVPGVGVNNDLTAVKFDRSIVIQLTDMGNANQMRAMKTQLRAKDAQAFAHFILESFPVPE